MQEPGVDSIQSPLLKQAFGQLSSSVRFVFLCLSLQSNKALSKEPMADFQSIYLRPCLEEICPGMDGWVRDVDASAGAFNESDLLPNFRSWAISSFAVLYA
jgi:hypothetical protein